MQNLQSEQRLITIAIHTYDRAIELQHLLEHNGIEVALHNVNLSSPVISSGIRVRIKESDLPAALRIIENREIFESVSALTSQSSALQLLVPVDFTPHSLKILEFSFNYAAALKADLILLHAYVNPALSKRVQLTDNFSFEFAESQEEDKRLYAAAQAKMDKVVEDIHHAIKCGELPPVKFTTNIYEGVPEDVILDVSKKILPVVIIMGTRSAAQKDLEQIGSVTAEVLDASRTPVMSIPKSIDFHSTSDIHNIVFLANLDQDDILGIDILSHILPPSSINLIFVKRPSKKDKDEDTAHSLENLIHYCTDHYPNFSFSFDVIPANPTEEDYRLFNLNHKVDFIAIPNKKRNIFSRFFNPSVAHRLLLRADAPIIMLPV